MIGYEGLGDTYINSFFSSGCCWCACLLPGRRANKLLVVSACCIALCLTAGTLARNRVYEDELFLWQDTVKKSPDKARAHNNLGYAYYLSDDLEKVREAYAKALQLNPGSVASRNNLLLLDSFMEK